jgi:preprotein translocase subunit SecE
VSLLAKKAGAAKRRNAISRAKKAAMQEDKAGEERRTAEAETASAPKEGKLRSLLRLGKNDKQEDNVQAPVKEKSKKETAKKDKRSPRVASGKPKKNFIQNSVKFLQSVWVELKKVHWPDRKQIIAYSSVVLLTVIVVAFLIWIADIAISWLVQLLLGL